MCMTRGCSKLFPVGRGSYSSCGIRIELRPPDLRKKTKMPHHGMGGHLGLGGLLTCTRDVGGDKENSSRSREGRTLHQASPKHDDETSENEAQ